MPRIVLLKSFVIFLVWLVVWLFTFALQSKLMSIWLALGERKHTHIQSFLSTPEKNTIKAVFELCLFCWAAQTALRQSLVSQEFFYWYDGYPKMKTDSVFGVFRGITHIHTLSISRSENSTLCLPCICVYMWPSIAMRGTGHALSQTSTQSIEVWSQCRHSFTNREKSLFCRGFSVRLNHENRGKTPESISWLFQECFKYFFLTSKYLPSFFVLDYYCKIPILREIIMHKSCLLFISSKE